MTQPEPTALDTCGAPCWDQGPPCELDRGHPEGSHVAPSVVQQPDRLFSGRIPSLTTRGRSYLVEVLTHGRATCECLAFTTFRPGQECSHIRIVREALSIPR